MEQRWERGRLAMKDSLGFLRSGEYAQALEILDSTLAQAIQENQGTWVKIICLHGEVVAHHMGDEVREIRYAEQALPYAKDYRFAAYNFAQLLLRNGQLDHAQRYATEAYELSVLSESKADRDLTAAILKQWPDIAQSR